MARRKSDLEKIITFVVFFLAIGIYGVVRKYKKEEILFYGYITLAVVLLILVLVVVFLSIRRKKRVYANIDRVNDDDILAMFKGWEPEEFEKKVAEIFSNLGYKAEHVGHPHDGGVDVEARRNGELYIIQCKRYKNNNYVGVKELRELNGVVDSHRAKKGFLVTTNGFTPAVEMEFKKNEYSRIELVDKFKLLEFYKASLKGKVK